MFTIKGMRADDVTTVLESRPKLDEAGWEGMRAWMGSSIHEVSSVNSVADAAAFLGISRTQVRKNGVRVNSQHTKDPDKPLDWQNQMVTVRPGKSWVHVLLLVDFTRP